MSINLEKETNYGAYIKDQRLHVFNLSQEEFAEKFNVPVGTLRNWEQNISQPPAHFIQLLKLETKNIRDKYKTPINKIRDENIEKTNDNIELNALRCEARKKINNDPTQKQIHDIIKTMTSSDGIIENLQTVSNYFDNYNTTDISAIMSLIMLEKISNTLDEINKNIKKIVK